MPNYQIYKNFIISHLLQERYNTYMVALWWNGEVLIQHDVSPNFLIRSISLMMRHADVLLHLCQKNIDLAHSEREETSDLVKFGYEPDPDGTIHYDAEDRVWLIGSPLVGTIQRFWYKDDYIYSITMTVADQMIISCSITKKP